MNKALIFFFLACLAAVLLTGCGTCQLNKQSLDQVQAARGSVGEWLKRPADGEGNIAVPKLLIEIHDKNLGQLEENIERAVKDE